MDWGGGRGEGGEESLAKKPVPLSQEQRPPGVLGMVGFPAQNSNDIYSVAYMYKKAVKLPFTVDCANTHGMGTGAVWIDIPKQYCAQLSTVNWVQPRVTHTLSLVVPREQRGGLRQSLIRVAGSSLRRIKPNSPLSLSARPLQKWHFRIRELSILLECKSVLFCKIFNPEPWRTTRRSSHM